MNLLNGTGNTKMYLYFIKCTHIFYSLYVLYKISVLFWFGWLYIYEALYMKHFLDHDILILGKSPIKWRQRPDMILAVDWNAKHQLKKK